jgi:DEAD/DEAH box helicase domain-containing protein
LCKGANQHLCTRCGTLQTINEKCSACGHDELVDVFRVMSMRTTTNAAGVSSTWHDSTCQACGSQNRL